MRRVCLDRLVCARRLVRERVMPKCLESNACSHLLDSEKLDTVVSMKNEMMNATTL